MGVQVSDQKVVVALQPLEAESKIRLDVIEELPSSETERIASRVAQAYLKQLKRARSEVRMCDTPLRDGSA